MPLVTLAICLLLLSGWLGALLLRSAAFWTYVNLIAQALARTPAAN